MGDESVEVMQERALVSGINTFCVDVQKSSERAKLIYRAEKTPQAYDSLLPILGGAPKIVINKQRHRDVRAQQVFANLKFVFKKAKRSRDCDFR